MAKVVSIIPTSKDKDTGAHSAQGTQVLLDDGTKLQGVQKVTLVAEAGAIWKAIIEVYPTNQKQIDALVSDVKVIDHGKAATTAKQTSGDDTEGADANQTGQ